jgi:hypothetical protein
MISDGEEAATAPVLWVTAEPERLERDKRELACFAPDLEYVPPGADPGLPHGGWTGRLPVWPFERPEPDGARELLGDNGIQIMLVYSSAHPVVPPTIFPLDPQPTIHECTQNAWHVAPIGSLCLLQTQGQWAPEASVTELLEKAAGWRIEYALMKAEAIDKMTTNGIATDDSLDALIAEVAGQPISRADEAND